ncbi:hypothetical protein B0T17DRAFT_603691 [Bombardia bombarda]|uniref:Rhodopsin domain-containing protein n=1 Tax=Bombardia bombarda TaxID=252184 RepID=A0AA39WC87_9PEZI|nr:hypothetical protein B0T17DRAFT_603691 [Bombardia bombarda]
MAVSLATSILILSGVFIALPTLAVSLRFYARFIKNAGISADDYLIVLGLLSSVGLSANNIVAVAQGGLGEHIHLDPETGFPLFDHTLTVFLQTEFASQLLSVLSLVFTKLSIVVFYRRIFRGNVFSLLSLLLLVAIAAWGISFFFATLFECMPISQSWTSLFGTPEHELYCYNYLPMFWATAISNMIMDIAILTLPMPFVWRLKMPARQKLAVTFIFLLGAFVVGISIARIYFFFQSSDSYANAFDITINIAPTIYWTMIEASIAVISACLPTFRPLFSHFSLETFLQDFASRFTLRSNSSKSNSGSLGSNHASKAWNQSLPNPSETSATKFVNNIEAGGVPSFEQQPIPLQDREAGITVQKSFYQTEQERRS